MAMTIGIGKGQSQNRIEYRLEVTPKCQALNNGSFLIHAQTKPDNRVPRGQLLGNRWDKFSKRKYQKKIADYVLVFGVFF